MLNETIPGVRVNEVYGSVSGILNSVRPNYRVPVRSMGFVKDYIKLATDYGIEINYTFNRSCLGNLHNLYVNKDTTQNHIDALWKAGVKRFTIASPLLTEHFRFPRVELSTIFNQLSIKALISMASLSSRIDKICLPIYINRDMIKLEKLQSILLRANINCELIVNEFCSAEGGICVRRNECYNIQSHGGNPNKEFDNYPVNKCMKARSVDPSNWLKAPFILPQDLKKYANSTGIRHFKVTGRTHGSESILKVISSYMHQYFNGSLCELWGIPLSKVYGELGYKPVDIPIPKLIGKKFSSKFFDHPMDCTNKICDVDCMYCANMYERIEHDR